MDETPDDAFGRRIAGQFNGVMEQFFVFVDRMAERYGLTEEERQSAVNHWCGLDIGDMYADWIDEDEDRED